MDHTSQEILDILDACCEAYTFPMLDNGYVYLAATRMTLFRSETDWALSIEVFGFSPRTGHPDNHVHTFASTLRNRKAENDYVTADAYQNYLANNPNNESRFLHAVGDDLPLDPDDEELLAHDGGTVMIRGREVSLPRPEAYAELGIELEEAPRVAVFELCRALAQAHRSELLATDEELRHNVLPEMSEVLRLNDWQHPDIVDDQLPSASATFQQLAQVLITGDASLYTPGEPNTHWKNWPDGGSL